MIASYNFTQSNWQLIDSSEAVVDVFHLPDTVIEAPAMPGMSQVFSETFSAWVSGVVLDDNTKRRFISNDEIQLIGLVDVDILINQFNHDKSSVLGDNLIENVVDIKVESDFPVPISGVITLDSSVLYLIFGEIVITNKIDCNGAELLGRNRSIDKITSTEDSSEIFTGNGQVNAKNITFSISGSSSKLFNLLGTGTEGVYMQDCTFLANTSLGTIENFIIVKFVNVPNLLPLGDLTLTDVEHISLQGFDTSEVNTTSTILTITGTSDLIEIFLSRFIVGVGQTAIDISGLTLLSFGDISAGSGFSGVGTFINGTISILWHIDARGVNVITDHTATGEFYISSNTETTIAAVNTPVKVAGTTTTGFLFRVDDDSSTDNRLKYLGAKTRIVNLNCSISVTGAANNKIYNWLIAKNGTPVTESKIQRLQGTGSDLGSLSFSWNIEMSTDDYVEVFVENITDDSNVTAELMTLTMN